MQAIELHHSTVSTCKGGNRQKRPNSSTPVDKLHVVVLSGDEATLNVLLTAIFLAPSIQGSLVRL